MQPIARSNNDVEIVMCFIPDERGPHCERLCSRIANFNRLDRIVLKNQQVADQVAAQWRESLDFRKRKIMMRFTCDSGVADGSYKLYKCQLRWNSSADWDRINK